MPVDSTVAPMPAGGDALDRQLAGLDALDVVLPSRPNVARRLWSGLWPPLLALALFIFAWQCVVWTGWKEEYILPSPFTVGQAFLDHFGQITDAALITLQRGAVGFVWALVIGGAVGLAAARSKVLRAAIGSLITGLSTMPSVAWTPLAVVLFKRSEAAILFVVVLGAAPSIASGLLSGIDHIPPILLRVGRVLGARGFASLRHVVLPAALPAFVGGLKQGWAFAWRSLMGAELLVFVIGRGSLGQFLKANQDVGDYPTMMATMIAVLLIGILIDVACFGRIEKAIRRRYGLIDAAAE